MGEEERRETGNWDRIFILLMLFGLLCLAWYASYQGHEERERLLIKLDTIHHIHCGEDEENCDHKHETEHYQSLEHKAAVKHAKEHKRLEKILDGSHDEHP